LVSRRKQIVDVVTCGKWKLQFFLETECRLKQIVTVKVQFFLETECRLKQIVTVKVQFFLETECRLKQIVTVKVQFFSKIIKSRITLNNIMDVAYKNQLDLPVPGPEDFGKNIWDTMILVALGYPENPTSDDVDKFRSYYFLQGNVLPCPKCSFNFNKHLEKYPLNNNVFYSKYNILMWIFNLKNEVNDLVGKREIPFYDFMTYVRKIGKKNRREDFETNSIADNSMWIFIAVLLVVIILIYYRKR